MNSAKEKVLAVWPNARCIRAMTWDAAVYEAFCYTIDGMGFTLPYVLGSEDVAWESAALHESVAKAEGHPWMVYELAGQRAVDEQRVIEFKAIPTGQEFAAHPDGSYVALTRVPSSPLSNHPVEDCSVGYCGIDAPDMKFSDKWLLKMAKAEEECGGMVGAGNIPYNMLVSAIANAAAVATTPSQEDAKAPKEHVWIASYTASERSGVLSRGLYFRSIHDSLGDALRMAPVANPAENFAVTEYARVPATDADGVKEYRFKTSEEAKSLSLPLQLRRLEEINEEICRNHNTLLIENVNLERQISSYPEAPKCECGHFDHLHSTYDYGNNGLGYCLVTKCGCDGYNAAPTPPVAAVEEAEAVRLLREVWAVYLDGGYFEPPIVNRVSALLTKLDAANGDHHD